MDPSQYILFIVLFILSGFFSGTEIALMSLPSHKIDSLVKQKLFGAKALASIKSNTDRLLIAILVGNNLINVYAAALATQISIEFARSSNMEEAVAVGIATGAITFLILVFGEIVPKSFASKNAERISLLVAYPYKILITVMFPVVYVLEKMIRLFTGKGVQTGITEEEIQTFIDLGKDSGTLGVDEHEMLRNTLEFGDTLIEEIMIPRVKLDTLSDTKTIKQAFDFYMKNSHSRIPVYHETVDNIIGIITIRDLLRERLKGNEDMLLKDFHFKKLVRSPINQPIYVLLETFKQARQHISIIMDEYGGVAGIVTLEDIVEEVFGSIHDETDFETDEIVEKSKDTYIIDSTILMHDIVDEFNLELADLGMEDKEFGSETVSYMITHKLERFPELEEEICFPIFDEEGAQLKEELCFKVLEIDDTAIGKVEVKKK